jgi:parallel beta-helix repeat protein
MQNLLRSISFNKYPLIVVCLAFILTACGGGGSDNTLALSGIVVDSTGAPVADATVTVHSDPIVVHTDQYGAFHCRIPPGHHHIRAEKYGRVFLDKDFDANESAGGHHDLGDIKTPYVPNATLTTIAITPPTATVAIGQTSAFTATGTYSDTTTADLTTQVTWSTINTAIASIDSAGTASGIALGSTSVSASFNGITSPTASLTVAAIPLNPVSALFPTNGANWNDYVQGTVSAATDTACNAASDTACVHGGERRVVVATGMSSCAGLTASDDLGAFNWKCDGSTNPVRFISTGLADDKKFSDLIDFTTQSFKSNKVSVNLNGNLWGVTPSTAWWTNPVVVNNSAGSLATASTVYLVTAQPNPAYAYTLDADKVALVIQPGLGLTGPGNGASVIASSNHNFLWIEGAVNATSDSKAVDLRYVNFSTLRNVAAYNALYQTSGDGIYLANAWYNRLSGITATNNFVNGVNLATASNNALSGVTASNNGSKGIYLNSTSNYNTLLNVTTSSNQDGIYLDNVSNNVLSEVTSANNLYSGVTLHNASITSNYNLLSDVTVSNDGYYGVFLGNSSNNILSDITASNDGYGVYLASSSNNTFTGLLQVGGNAYSNCTVGGGSNQGLVTSTCANNGSSDATLTTGITLASSFIGKVASNDVLNGSDATGMADFSTVTSAFDWTHFNNAYRGWGIDGSAFPSTDQRGRWTTGAGRIWDWSVSSSDTVLRGVLALPTGNDSITQIWSDASTTTFLRHAVEISGDGIGNDNGLCESGETCLYTSNIGSYQGHGNLVSAGTFSTGTLTGITLMQYAINGR